MALRRVCVSKAEFWVGTSGWSYKHWRGRFYPEELPTTKWFDHFSEHFRTVELNNSFYRLPKAQTWGKWRKQAPPGFCFAIFQPFPHPHQTAGRLRRAAEAVLRRGCASRRETRPDFVSAAAFLP
jgi:uncharacterized protein YecE (DUF72 family)